MKRISEYKDQLKNLYKNELLAIRVEYAASGDLDLAIYKIRTGESSVIELSGAYSLDSAYRELGEEIVKSYDLLKGMNISMQCYFDYHAYGRDLYLGGDYSIVKIKGNYFAVNNY